MDRIIGTIAFGAAIVVAASEVDRDGAPLGFSEQINGGPAVSLVKSSRGNAPSALRLVDSGDMRRNALLVEGPFEVGG